MIDEKIPLPYLKIIVIIVNWLFLLPFNEKNEGEIKQNIYLNEVFNQIRTQGMQSRKLYKENMSV